MSGRLPIRLSMAEGIAVFPEDFPNPARLPIIDWFDYRSENDPAFLRRIERARQRIREGEGVRLEDTQD